MARVDTVLAVLNVAGAFAPPVRRADRLTLAGAAAATTARSQAGVGRACLVCGERARRATTASHRRDPGRAVWIDLCRRHYWQLVDELIVHAG